MRTLSPSADGSSVRDHRAVLELEVAGESFLAVADDQGGQWLFVLEPGDTHLTLGRRPGCDITIAWDHRVSGLHAELRAVGGSWLVVDDGLSTNGTFVNGERIAGRRRLADRDTITLGATIVRVHFPPARGSRATVVDEGPRVELTPMQRKVLVALCRPFHDGRAFATPATNQDIAAELFLSTEAVKTHLRVIYTRFGVAELAQNAKRQRTAQLAIQLGLVGARDYGNDG